jgi:uncharacterized delta-60 repeat protein
MSSSTYESRADRARRTGSPLCALWRSLRASALALLSSLPLYAAPGDLDPTFGEGGHAAFSFPGHSYALATASVLQANGKLTIAGQCNSGQCMLRMRSDGALDSGFGDGGRVTNPVLGLNGVVNAIAYQDDGRLLLGGHCSSSLSQGPCVVRQQANGALDTSFGVQGVVILSVSTWVADESYVRSIQPLSDGRIALGVSCAPAAPADRNFFCAARLQSSGALDASFGSGGVVTVVPEVSQGESQYLSTAAIDAAGRWVVAGECSGSPLPSSSFCAVRLQPNGARDLSFGINGAFVLGDVHTIVNVLAAALNTDGGMVLGGLCTSVQTGGINTCFVALTPTGLSDQAFGTNGGAVISYGSNLSNNPRFTRQPHGSLVVVNQCYTSQTDYDICLIRLRSDGTPDPTLPLTSDARAYDQLPVSIAVDMQGRIVVSGSCKSTAASGYDQFCAARFEGGPFANTMCSFDLDGDGLVTPRVDGLVLLRASLGFSANSILQGVNFPAGAKRTVWGGGGANDLRQYLVAHCGMSIAPVAVTN